MDFFYAQTKIRYLHQRSHSSGVFRREKSVSHRILDLHASDQKGTKRIFLRAVEPGSFSDPKFFFVPFGQKRIDPKIHQI